MQPDLLGLEFSKGELRRLTGVDPDNVFRSAISQHREQRTNFLLNEILLCFVISCIIIGLIYTFSVLANIATSQLAIALLSVVPVTVIIGRWLWRKKTFPKALRNILDSVDRYHAVIKAIDINEQIEAGKDLKDRSLIISALQLIREDLVRALRIERSLRSNKKPLTNSDITNNLPELTAMQSPQASDYRRIFNEALQISKDVQEEMRKLERQHSNYR